MTGAGSLELHQVPGRLEARDVGNLQHTAEAAPREQATNVPAPKPWGDDVDNRICPESRYRRIEHVLEPPGATRLLGRRRDDQEIDLLRLVLPRRKPHTR